MQMSSHDMSEVIRRMTIATIIFLPLTVLGGYIRMFYRLNIPWDCLLTIVVPQGMNFDRQWSWHHGHSDVM